MSTAAQTNRLIDLLCDERTDERDEQILNLLGITGPGGYICAEPDGRICVWSSEDDSEQDDGARAIWRSYGPIKRNLVERLAQLAWIDLEWI